MALCSERPSHRTLRGVPRCFASDLADASHHYFQRGVRKIRHRQAKSALGKRIQHCLSPRYLLLWSALRAGNVCQCRRNCAQGFRCITVEMRRPVLGDLLAAAGAAHAGVKSRAALVGVASGASGRKRRSAGGKSNRLRGVQRHEDAQRHTPRRGGCTPRLPCVRIQRPSPSEKGVQYIADGSIAGPRSTTPRSALLLGGAGGADGHACALRPAG